MQQVTETIDILNDLVLINNDRIAGYNKAIDELNKTDTTDNSLVSLFERFIDESDEYRNDLAEKIEELGGEPAEGTMTSGKIYRAWMDIKALFTGNDRHTILANCEAGEDAAQKAYKTALEEEDLDDEIRELLHTHKEQLLDAHNEIKALRDSSK